MACKKCKKKATELTTALLGEKPKSKECKDCHKTGVEKDMEWLDEGEGKVYNHFAQLLTTEKIIVWVFGWAPLLVGYFSIIKFFVSLFTS